MNYSQLCVSSRNFSACSFLVVPSLPLVASSQIGTDQYLAEVSRGTLCTSLALSVQLSPLWYSAALASPKSLLCLNSGRLQALSGFILQVLQPGSSQGSKLEQSQGSPHLFPFSQGSVSCVAYCSMSENCFLSFVLLLLLLLFKVEG